jgi:transposase
MHPSQLALLDIPEQPEHNKTTPPKGRPKLIPVNRQQSTMAMIYVEELIPSDHKARAIWALTEKLDLSKFYEPLRTTVGEPGRSGWDPRLLVSLWVYAYSEGISAGREIERVMQWEPGMMWLAGLEKICHHKLSDFRADHKEALDELFAQLLAVLDSAGLVSLEQVMHDGSKIRAQAGADTFRREKTLRERLAQARAAVAEMGDPRGEGPVTNRQRAARERAAREREELLEASLKELTVLQAEKKEDEKSEVRVSTSEPQARLMKHGDHAIAPSYNAQISTDAAHKIIVGVHLSQCSSDAQSLLPAIEEVEENLGRTPPQVVVDGGFTNRNNIVECAEQQIDLVGSLPDPKERSAAAMKALGISPEFAPAEFRILDSGERLECPAGSTLEKLKKNRKHGDLYQQYRARGADCMSCPHQKQCCPRHPEKGRTVSIRLEEQADVAAFRKKMESEQYKSTYKKRGAVAEFPNAWIKEKLGLRKFRMRGLAKAATELVWACLTYNIMQWVREIWRKPVIA